MLLGFGRRKGEYEYVHTSDAVVLRAGQSSRERILNRSFGSDSSVSLTSSQSLGWRGKAADVDLQALTAQVRKLRVRTFMVEVVIGEVLQLI